MHPDATVSAQRVRPQPEPEPEPEVLVLDIAPRQGVAQLIAVLDAWLMRHSVSALRVSLGAVFLGFGALKLFPGVSPAQGIAIETTERLTFGVVSGEAALLMVALLECTIGLIFLSGRFMGLGVAMLGVQMVGILSPLVLLSGQLFTGPDHAPNLVGLYVLKDVVLAGAGLVVAAAVRGGRFTREGPRG